MECIFYIYQGKLPLIKTSNINDVNNNIIYIEIKYNGYKHIIKGFDNYWVDIENNEYGCFNNQDPDGIEALNRIKNNHEETIYYGLNEVAYKFDGNNHILINTPNLVGKIILKGIMIPDNEAKEIGLI